MKPYSQPESNLIPSSPVSVDPTVEAIRREHLHAEAHIKQIGLLYLLGSFIGIYLAIDPVFTKAHPNEVSPEGLAVAQFIMALAIGQGVVGVGLRQLRGWSRYPAIVLTLPWLLAFPIGTVIGLLVMISLQTKGARMVFSAEYKAVMAATRHIDYESVSRILSVFFMLVVAIVVAVAVGAIFMLLSR